MNNLDQNTTKRLNYIIAFVTSILLITDSLAAVQSHTPVAVVLLTKHGVSIPQKVEDPLIANVPKQKEINHALEPNGQRMMFLLGAKMAQEYGLLMNPQQSGAIKSTKVYSAFSERADQSGQCFLYGAFPPGTGAKFETASQEANPELKPPFKNFNSSNEYRNPSVIPHQMSLPRVETPNPQNDLFFHTVPEVSCPGYAFNITDRKATIVDFELMKPQKGELLNSTQQIFASHSFGGLESVRRTELIHFMNVAQGYLYSRGQLLHPMDQWNYHALKILAGLSETQIYFPTHNDTLIHTHSISKYIVQAFRNAQGSDDFKPKFTLFSGHGRNIQAFLLALNVASEDCYKEALKKNLTSDTMNCQAFPEFGSSLNFELSKDTSGNYFIRVLYNGKNLHVCGKSYNYCPWLIFETFLNTYFIGEKVYDRACVNYNEIDERVRSLKSDAIIFRVGVVVCIVLSSMFIMCIVIDVVFRRKDRKKILETMKRYKAMERQRRKDNHVLQNENKGSVDPQTDKL